LIIKQIVKRFFVKKSQNTEGSLFVKEKERAESISPS
jgi:hypothetical protein